MTKRKYCIVMGIIVIVLILAYFLNLKKGLLFVGKMGSGWNLGNSLDVKDIQVKDPTIEDYETYWNNPITDKEMVEIVKTEGVDSIRIPVTWEEHKVGSAHV